MDKLILYKDSDLLGMTHIREGEVKLGQKLASIGHLDDLAQHPSRFVLIGIPEDIGIRANGGKAGASATWNHTIKAFCNIQHTEKLLGEQVLALGYLDFSEELALAEKAAVEQLRALTAQIDEVVTEVLVHIFEAGKIPLVVGGGHNNAYPILKALSLVNKKPVNTINVDAHADFRLLEGRHSGNGFSYAFEEGYLNKYALIGLHENYNSQYLIDQLKGHPDRISYTFFEDILQQKTPLFAAFEKALQFTDGLCGLEIDMDSVANLAASAATPSGFTAEEIRALLYQTKGKKIAYLHLCEASASENNLVSKLLAYLLSDFIKAQS